MDGVLIDSEPCYYQRLEEYLLSRGYHFSKEVFDSLVGESSKKTYSILKAHDSTFFDDETVYRDDYRKFYQDKPIDYRNLVNPHVHQVLKTLRKMQWRLGLASSSPKENIMHVLDVLQIRENFEIIASGHDFQQSKPHPQIYLTVAKKMGVIAQECYAVEDSTYGIQAAYAAGMKIIAKKDRRYSFDQRVADIVIDDLQEILSRLDVNSCTGFTNIGEIL